MLTTAYLKLINDTLAFLGRPSDLKKASPLCSEKIGPSEHKKTIQQSPPLFNSKPFTPLKTKARLPIPLEKPKPSSSPGEDKWRALFKTALKEIYLHENIPNDSKAKRLKEAWREKHNTPEVPILFQGSYYKPFLQSLAKAIETEFLPCRLVEIDHLEKEKKWDLFLDSPKLKLIIAPDQLIFAAKELLPFYKEHPQQGTRFLGEIPLLLIPDLSLYFKDPYLKRSLWNVICQALKPKDLPPSY